MISVFGARQHIYRARYMLSTVRLSVRLPVTWVAQSEKQPHVFCGIGFIHKFWRVPSERRGKRGWVWGKWAVF